MVSGILVTHGTFGAELIATAKSIFGDFEGCHAVSNEGKAPEVLREEIEKIVDASGEGDNTIILVDFFGGSCCHACLLVQQTREGVKLVTGVNLPMFLAFLNKRDEVPFVQLPQVMVSRGKSSVREIDPEHL